MKRKSTGDSRLVYSTESGRLRPDSDAPRDRNASAGKRSQPGPRHSDGIVRLHRQSKGRGGKTVTLIEGLPGSAAELRERAKQLKRHCGVGGAVKERGIEIQGDQRERLAEFLRAEGFTVKLAGG